MRRNLSIIILGVILLLASVQPAQADTITVTTTVDKLSVPCPEIGLDDLPLPGGTSLREAMCIANNHSGEDTISFNLSGCSVTCTIQPIIGLPVLSDDGTTIDGYSQTGASPATATSAAQLVIVLDGQNVENFWGITIGSANNHITGLVIHSFGKSGIGIGSIFATDNLITGNFIGTTESGFVEPDLYGNQEHGIHIKDGAKNNTIGGDSPAERNLISGNISNGILIEGTNVSGNTVQGNYIGTDVTGLSNYGNSVSGVSILNGAQNNLIGGDSPAERNIIAGNVNRGVMVHGVGTYYNTVSGNYINVGVDGETRLPTQNSAVEIAGSAQYNTIGGDTPGERNIISGSGTSGSAPGVYIFDPGTSHNTVSGNYIGTDATGTLDVGNNGNGVRIANGASDNIIGGDDPGEGNLISGNNSSGVYLYGEGTRGNIVSGNLIGLDSSGASGLGNRYSGVAFSDVAQDNIIGGDTPAERNVISANGGSGVSLGGVNTYRNVISGNYIGLAANGLDPLGNEEDGVRISSAAGNTLIGGDDSGEGNLISANGENGINISGDDVRNITVSGNYIGTDLTGTLDRGNTGDGIQIENGAAEIQIGGTTPNERNLISGNGRDGIFMCCGYVVEVTIYGNYIGTDISGNHPLGNAGNGINIAGDAFGTTIGGDTPNKRNVIGANQNGIRLEATFTYDTGDHHIAGNYIGLGADGLTPLGNYYAGVNLSVNAQNNTIGGVLPGEGNYITYNDIYGVLIDTPIATGNVISRNSIFSNNGARSGIHLSNGANGGLQLMTPIILSTVDPAVTVTGTALPGSTVELFASPDADGEGQTYLGSATAGPAGDFTLQVDYLPNPYLTVTATYEYDGVNDWDGTSMFSQVYTATILGGRPLYLPLIRNLR